MRNSYTSQSADLQRIKEKYNNQSSDLQRLKTEFAKQTADLNTINDKYANQTTDLQKLITKHTTQSDDFQKLQAEYSYQTADLQTMNEKFTSQTVELNSQKEELQRLKTKCTNQTADLQSLNEICANQTSDLEKLKGKYTYDMPMTSSSDKREENVKEQNTGDSTGGEDQKDMTTEETSLSTDHIYCGADTEWKTVTGKNQSHNKKVEKTVSVPAGTIGLIIGRGGSSVKRLEDMYEVRVKVGKSQVTVKGSEEKVQITLRAIRKIVECKNGTECRRRPCKFDHKGNIDQVEEGKEMYDDAGKDMKTSEPSHAKNEQRYLRASQTQVPVTGQIETKQPNEAKLEQHLAWLEENADKVKEAITIIWKVLDRPPQE